MTASGPPNSNPPVPGRPERVDLSELPGVDCPCGVARRAFADRQDFPGTIHLTEIHQDARTHYHRTLTEVYVVLDCDAGAAIELDGELHPVKPKTTVLIPPGTRHRAVGKMEVLIVCLPKFDPTDEHFDGGSPLSPAVGAKSTGKNPG